MTYEEADNIASTIRIGGLNVELEELSSEVVGAQLGQEAGEHKFDRRCNWSCTGMYFHVLGISSSGTCSQYGTAAFIYTERSHCFS